MKDLSSLVMRFWNLHQAITFIRITAIMLFIICGVTECMADVNTSAFLHKKDVIDLNNNSIEFTYWDGCDHKIKTKNYTISSLYGVRI